MEVVGGLLEQIWVPRGQSEPRRSSVVVGGMLEQIGFLGVYGNRERQREREARERKSMGLGETKWRERESRRLGSNQPEKCATYAKP